MRNLISIVAGLLILVAGFYACSKLSEQKERPEKKAFEKIPSVKIIKAKNSSINNTITAYGKGFSKDKIEIFAEVTGNVVSGSKKFKEGIRFSQGEALIRIQSSDFYMNLLSQRSNFLNTLTGLVADMRVDYPENAKNWEIYLSEFNIEKPVSELPSTSSDKEKYFVSTHNIYNQYYAIKNAEALLNKYTITAPTNGIVTLSTINTGSLVRPGQKLGEFIGTSAFEMEAGVHISMIEQIKVGQSANIFLKGEATSVRKGRIVRINNAIDQQTQLVKVYIELDGKGLKDGTYLTATINIGKESDVIKIPRNYLVEDRFLYQVKKEKLVLLDAQIINTGIDSVIVKGIPENTKIVAQQIRGGFEGMKVKTYQ